MSRQSRPAAVSSSRDGPTLMPALWAECIYFAPTMTSVPVACICVCCAVLAVQTPPLAMIQQFCADAAAWLAADPVNVVVVHCKAGKGRTGIMICSLLLYLHRNAPDLANLAADTAAAGLQKQQNTAGACSCGADGVVCPTCQAGGPFSISSSGLQQQQCSSRLWHPWQHVAPVQLRQLEQPVRDVLDMYAERRTHDGNGVTIKSQRRCVAACVLLRCHLQLSCAECSLLDLLEAQPRLQSSRAVVQATRPPPFLCFHFISYMPLKNVPKRRLHTLCRLSTCPAGMWATSGPSCVAAPALRACCPRLERCSCGR
jgi:hypothetical protein